MEPLVRAAVAGSSGHATAGGGRPGAGGETQKLLTPKQIETLRAGTAKEDQAFLATLPQEQAEQVLALMPGVRQKIEILEAKAAEARNMVPPGQPPLRDLLTPQQIQLLRTGSDKEGLDFLATLPREKAVQVLSIMPVVRQRLMPQLDSDLRMMVEAAAPAPVQPGQTLAQGKLYRAVYSDRQLQEVLVDFWFNHFNVDREQGLRTGTWSPATSATPSVRMSWANSAICWKPRPTARP